MGDPQMSTSLKSHTADDFFTAVWLESFLQFGLCFSLLQHLLRLFAAGAALCKAGREVFPSCAGKVSSPDFSP